MGTYTQKERDVIMCACSSSQAYTVKKAVHEVDEDAFVMLTETNQVFGEGSSRPEARGDDERNRLLASIYASS